MLVGDLVYNDELECDCNYEIHDGTELLFSTKTDGLKKPLDCILDRKVKQVTVNMDTMIIEVA